MYLATPYQLYQVQPNNDQEYQYSYYILPNYFASVDLVNLEIKEFIRDFNYFYTALYTDLQDKSTYPQLLRVGTDDVQQYDQPTLFVNAKNIYPTFFTVELINKVSSGFIVIGLKDGSDNSLYNANPTLQ